MKQLLLLTVLFSSLNSSAQDDKPVFDVRRAIVKIEPGTVIGYPGESKLKGFVLIGKEGSEDNIIYSREFEYGSLLTENDLIERIEKELVKKSLNVRGYGHVFEELRKQKKPDYAIAVLVDSLYFNYKGGGAPVGSSVSFFNSKLFSDVKVLDLNRNLLVFDKKIQSLYISTDKGRNENRYNFAYYFIKAFSQLVDDMYNDPDFAKLLSPKKVNTYSLADSSEIKIARNYTVQANTINIKRCLESVVTIQTGGGHCSGAIISADGLILTCYHGIYANETVDVILSNNVKLKAKTIRTAPEYDVALLKLENAGAVSIPLADTNNINTGEEVWIIGTPGFAELGQTVTRGIISGNRVINDQQYLQTDAAVSPGSSGGPLLNIHGQIIGIINAKTISRGVEGVGFAIPISVAMKKLKIKLAD
jgi:S1-C subfamily serine protease